RIVMNNGVVIALSIDLSVFPLRAATGDLLTPKLAFNKIQDAKRQSAVADFIAYASLGIPMNVRVTAVLQQVTNSSTIYRWFADSSDNSPVTGVGIAVGTGLVTFDGKGNLVGTSNGTISIDRENIPS